MALHPRLAAQAARLRPARPREEPPWPNPPPGASKSCSTRRSTWICRGWRRSWTSSVPATRTCVRPWRSSCTSTAAPRGPSPSCAAPWPDRARRRSRLPHRGSRPSTATGWCACWAKGAWAPSTRRSRTARADPSPSRSSAPASPPRASSSRFTHEAQILARLHHPGIAQVYEAGLADDGQPFFAMELIRGLPLDEYADRHGLDLAARVGLVARVCDAVQHAHDQGVIHRDLKPANILVEETGQPKVLDFGVARATDADLLTAAGLTRTGQLLGTPNYMSPEQVAGDPAAIDRRADVYALGVILFELAAHRLPYRLEDRPLAEAARLILEEDPPRLGSLDPELRGDVETIVAKALEKDPARRYPSAADLAADLRRWLAHEPILARPPSALYHLRKFARRNKALVGGVAATGAALVLGLVGTILFAVGEARQRGQAEQNARAALGEKREAQFQAYRARLSAAAAAICRARRGRCRASAGRGAGGPARLGVAAPAQPARRQHLGDPLTHRWDRTAGPRPGPSPGRDRGRGRPAPHGPGWRRGLDPAITSQGPTRGHRLGDAAGAPGRRRVGTGGL